MSNRFIFKLIKARLKLWLTKKRFIQSYKKKKAILTVFLGIVNIFILSDVIEEAKKVDLTKQIVSNSRSYGISVDAGVSGNQPASVTAEAKEEDENSSSESLSVDEIVSVIHKLESSEGKNNYSKCEEQGLHNEYGYAIPGDGSYRCFEKGEDRKEVIAWFERRFAEGMNLETATCYYNTGIPSEDCEYLKNFNKLKA